ncbi:MAG: Cna B-type domain-containing protein [Anaerovoracaceae bacterium]
MVELSQIIVTTQKWGGGTVYAANSTLTINGGTFEGNKTKGRGGVICYNGQSADNKLLITDGTFINNKSEGFGGAIFLDCVDPTKEKTIGEISGGEFTENESKFAGGAIYIQEGAEMKLKKSYIVGNQATLATGGGIWNCPTGGGDYYTFHGMYLTNNSASKGGDDFYSEGGINDEKPNVYVTDYAFNGDKINWTYDTQDTNKGKLAPNEYYQNSKEEIALKSGLKENSSLGSNAVIFSNNKAPMGGAIANNGHLQLGEESKMSIKKQTTTATDKEFTFNLSLTRDNKGFKGSFIYKDDSTNPVTLNRIEFDETGSGVMKLKSGQTVTIVDLPVNTHLEIKEVSLPNGWSLKSSNNTSVDFLEDNGKAPVITAEFINELNTTPPPILQTGDLNVLKTVSGDDASTTKEFPFSVILSDTTINGTYGDMTFVDGISNFTLKANESKTAKGLPVGIDFFVSESNNEDYTVTVNGGNATTASGIITANTTGKVAFNNHKSIGGSGGSSELKPVRVTVHKFWRDNDSVIRPSSVYVQLYNDGEAYGKPVKLNGANDWTKEWNNLDGSVKWTVNEVNVPKGYKKTVTNSKNNWIITNKLKANTPDKFYDDVPQSGDNFNVALWLMLITLSSVGIVALSSGKRKNDSQGDSK